MTDQYSDTTFGGVFAKFVPKVWAYQYRTTLLFQDIACGVPSDPKVAEGWIKSKIKDPAKSDRIRQAVEDIMQNRGLTEDEATEEVNSKRNCNGFLRDRKTGQFYIMGYQIKAALKEAVSVAVAADNIPAKQWGKTGKGAISFASEHIQVVDEHVFLTRGGQPVTQADEVKQSFPINKITKQTSIQYTEICRDVAVTFTVATDWQFTDEQWGTIWVTGNLQGIGASRSQDHGRYNVVAWDRI